MEGFLEAPRYKAVSFSFSACTSHLQALIHGPFPTLLCLPLTREDLDILIWWPHFHWCLGISHLSSCPWLARKIGTWCWIIAILTLGEGKQAKQISLIGSFIACVCTQSDVKMVGNKRKINAHQNVPAIIQVIWFSWTKITHHLCSPNYKITAK